LAVAVYYKTSPEGLVSASDSIPLAPYESAVLVGEYDAQKKPVFFGKVETLASAGQPGIDVVRIDDPLGGSPFSSRPAQHLSVEPNPYVLGWNFQSFDVWDSADQTAGRRLTAQTYGAPTPASAVPTSGAATFNGKLAGLYISPAGEGSIAAADLAVNASFSSRSLSFASTGTTLTRDLSTGIAAPNLNMSGTLSYSPTTNTFSGTLKNASGTMSGTSSGHYYGPAAQELGGVFKVKSPTSVETFVGAYGAKR
jgi:hypothetical protein